MPFCCFSFFFSTISSSSSPGLDDYVRALVDSELSAFDEMFDVDLTTQPQTPELVRALVMLSLLLLGGGGGNDDDHAGDVQW
jgi:hypothetical protein